MYRSRDKSYSLLDSMSHSSSMGFLFNGRSIVIIIVVVFSSVAMIPGSQAGGCGCPPLWTGFGENCYRFFSQNLTWFDAENYCREFTVPCSDGDSVDLYQGHLTSVHSRAEFAFLTSMYESIRVKRSSSSVWVWIGLHDKATEDSYEWSDGTRLDFTTWSTGQPNNYQDQDCTMFRREDEYNWHDLDCDYIAVEAFICKMSKW